MPIAAPFNAERGRDWVRPTTHSSRGRTSHGDKRLAGAIADCGAVLLRTRHGSGAICHLKARQRRASKPEGGEQEVKLKVRADQKLRDQEYDESELGLFGFSE